MCKKGTVILLDDEETVRKGFENLFDDLSINLELLLCSNLKEFDEKLKSKKEDSSLKSIIVDLANTHKEEDSKEFAINEYILDEFNTNRIPIFIHSGFLDKYENLENKGTVFKVSKSKDSINAICENLKVFEESGFLDIFSVNGNIESKIMTELHSAFVNQFEGNELVEIINSIKHRGVNIKERTNEVFQRIAIRALFENLIKEKQLEDGTIEEVKINAIEHYYRRTSKNEFWTGDIFKSEDGGQVVLLTPRCNLAHSNFDQLLICHIKEINEETYREFQNSKKGEENLRKNIVDDVKKTGEKFRFLPSTPQFKGGYVDFSSHYTFKVDDFKKLFKRSISLSEELTNDVVRKFASYILRLGITETDVFEASYFVKTKE